MLRQRYNRSVGFTPAAFIGPVLGVIVWATIDAAASGRLGRNRWVGIRTAATGASDKAWLAGHRAALRPARAGMLALLLLSVPAWILPRHPDVQTTCTVLIVLVTVADLTAITVASTRGSRRAS